VWQQAPAPPWSPRAFHSVDVFGGRMWLAAGTDLGRAFGSFNDIW